MFVPATFKFLQNIKLYFDYKVASIQILTQHVLIQTPVYALSLVWQPKFTQLCIRQGNVINNSVFATKLLTPVVSRLCKSLSRQNGKSSYIFWWKLSHQQMEHGDASKDLPRADVD